MTNKQPVRTVRFRAALALAGLTQNDWAADNDMSQGYLSLILSGKRQSSGILAEIDLFIAEQEKKAAKRYGAFLRDFRGSAK